jgi:hypothetical protein
MAMDEVIQKNMNVILLAISSWVQLAFATKVVLVANVIFN